MGFNGDAPTVSLRLQFSVCLQYTFLEIRTLVQSYNGGTPTSHELKIMHVLGYLVLPYFFGLTKDNAMRGYFFSKNLRSKWSGPYQIREIFPMVLLK